MLPHKDVNVISTAASFPNTKHWEQPKCTSRGEWTHKALSATEQKQKSPDY